MRWILFAVALMMMPSPAAEKAAGKANKDAGKAALAPKLGVKTPGVQIPFASLKAEADIPLPGIGSALAFSDAVLVPLESANQIARVVARTNKPGDPIAGLSKPCGGLAVAFTRIWAPNCGTPSLMTFETRSGKPGPATVTAAGPARSSIAASGDSIWLLSDALTNLSRIDPQENAVVGETRLPAGCSSVSFGEAALWVTCPGEPKLLRIEPRTGLVVNRIEVAKEPVAAVAGEGSIWVLSRAEGKVAKIDPKTNKVTATIELGIPNADGNIAFGEGSVWVSAPGFPITRINPQTDKVVQQFAGPSGMTIHFGLGSVWLTNPAQGTLHRYDPKRIAATLAD